LRALCCKADLVLVDGLPTTRARDAMSRARCWTRWDAAVSAAAHASRWRPQRHSTTRACCSRTCALRHWRVLATGQITQCSPPTRSSPTTSSVSARLRFPPPVLKPPLTQQIDFALLQKMAWLSLSPRLQRARSKRDYCRGRCGRCTPTPPLTPCS